MPIRFQSLWGDLLTSYDGKSITYDTIGNPLSDGSRTFEWQHGRELAAQTKNGVEWEYTYDANGMRTSRESDAKTYDYVYSGDKLVQMTVTDTATNTEQLLEFTYDAAGQPLTMTLDGTLYYYVLNIQGDVMGMVDGNGNLMAAYSYTSYGEAYSIDNVSSINTILVGINPLTYRGYVLDMGTNLYYLQTRYYDPTLGRFINADGLVSTGQALLGKNMFAYCQNNAVNNYDPEGMCTKCYYCGIILEYCYNSSCPTNALPEDYNGSNYSNYDRSDLWYEYLDVNTDISQSEANEYLYKLQRGNYGMLLGVNPIPALLGLIPVAGEALSFAYEFSASLESYGYSDTFDPAGRLLYLEEGYHVLMLNRGFMVDDTFFTETEYFIYDSNWVLQYNDVVKTAIFNTD